MSIACSNSKLKAGSFIAMLVLLGGCSSLYYGTMEKFGIQKREIMVDRVEDAKDAQKDGEKQFVSSLESFKNLVNFEGGELEKAYDTLSDEYEQSKSASQRISERIEAIEDVSDAMFDEWDDELKRYSSDRLRRDSEEKLKETRLRYKQLMRAMHDTEDKIDPILQVMEDQVLYLKHNLNARAINSLKNEINEIDVEVEQLVDAMQKAISEAETFIDNMKS